MSAAPTQLRRIKAGPLSVQVFDTMRAAIFAGELQPGDSLRELHLARELNVSQATVREALAQLERIGLVVRTPNIGTHVTRLTRQDIQERFDLRLLLEERAMREASARMTREAFALLATRLDALSDATARNQYFEEAQADLEFHRVIWKQSGNRTLYHTLDQISVPLFAFVSLVRRANRQKLREVVQSHEGLVQALRDRSRKSINRALHHHFEHLSIPDVAPSR
jgi:DNA-binding GntR family transcriptional regulator